MIIILSCLGKKDRGLPMTRLKAENITINYGDKTIISDLSLNLPDQQIIAIIGANGSGKSTLLKTLTRILPYQKGQVILDGKQLSQIPTLEIAKQMAILPQTPESISDLVVSDLISYGRTPYLNRFGQLSKDDYKIVEWAMQATRTFTFRNQTLDSLSGGQRQRVWIALALAQQTDFIFLDEPTTYLDIAHQLEVLQLLQALNQQEKRTIVMVLHDINQAARFADYLIAMKDGKIIKSGSAKEVITTEVLREIYQIEAKIEIDPKTNKPLLLTYDLLNDEQTILLEENQ